MGRSDVPVLAALPRRDADRVENALLATVEVRVLARRTRREPGLAKHPVDLPHLPVKNVRDQPVADFEADRDVRARMLDPVWPAWGSREGIPGMQVVRGEQRHLAPRQELP